MDEVKLALEMNKLVHDECKDVPHDIGLRLLEIVKMNVNEQLKQPPIIRIGRWKCMLCGRDKFTHKSPHKCVGGFRKRKIIWQELS